MSVGVPRLSPRFSPRALKSLAAGVAVLAVLALAGAHLAARQIESRLLAALGPRASVGGVSVGLTRVVVTDLRVASAGGGAWPVADELRAASLEVRPGLRSLWSGLRGGPWVIDDVLVRDGYVSALRSRDGKLRLVPSLMDRAKAAPATPASSAAPKAMPASAREADDPPVLVIEQVRVENTVLDFHDASLKRPVPHRLRFEGVDAHVGPLALPGLDQAVSIDLSARLKGVERDGLVSLAGSLTPATKDADLAFRVKDVDLVALQPYLFRLNDGGVRHGRLDLTLDARVQRQHLHAPGTVTISGLELSSSASGGMFGGLGTSTRQALLDLMAQKGRLSAKFTLDGRLDDPGFSLNESLATRFASGVADSLGVGVEGVVQGMGRVLKGLVGR